MESDIIVLNEQQKAAQDKIVAWFNDKNSNQVFTLQGYAGCGKTFLVSHTVQNVLCLDENEYALCTPTGKAATVLIAKNNECTTIHRLIYTPYDIENKIVDDEGNVIIKRDVKFIKKPSIDKKLIIIDEFSMVNNEIFQDLLSYNIKILAVGDIGQLPPVNSKQLDYLCNPDAELTEIVRQQKDSMILKIAEQARFGNRIKYGNFNNEVIVLYKKSLTQEQILDICINSDQVIAGTLRTCKNINDMIRNYLGFTSKYPEPGDKLICLQNNYNIELNDRFNLVNGLIGKCEKFTVTEPIDGYNLASLTFTPELTNIPIEDIISDPYEASYEKSPYELFQQVYRSSNNKYVPKVNVRKRNTGETYEEYEKFIEPFVKARRNAIEIIQMNHFQFGYCITCHKSQGSEWDSVVVFDESWIFKDLGKNWLYTAITRAKKKCIIIK